MLLFPVLVTVWVGGLYAAATVNDIILDGVTAIGLAPTVVFSLNKICPPLPPFLPIPVLPLATTNNW